MWLPPLLSHQLHAATLAAMSLLSEERMCIVLLTYYVLFFLASHSLHRYTLGFVAGACVGACCRTVSEYAVGLQNWTAVANIFTMLSSLYIKFI